MTIYRLFSDIFILACLAGRKQFSSFQGMPTYFSMLFSRSSCAWQQALQVNGKYFWIM